MTQYTSAIPYCWQDETVAILASGSTLCQEDIDKLQGKCKIIAINDSYILCPWADVLYASDCKWWNVHDYVREFKGDRWTQTIGRPDWPRMAHSHGINVVKGAQRINRELICRLSDDRDILYTGNNSAFAAMNLGIMAGSKRILLLGVDMQVINGKRHWFGDHPKTLKNKGGYAHFRKCFKKVRKALELRGIEVVNCSPRSTLSCFRKAKIDEVI